MFLVGTGGRTRTVVRLWRNNWDMGVLGFAPEAKKEMG